MTLPYPGIIKSKERSNVESLDKNFFKIAYFRFAKDLINKSVPIITIPRNYLIYSIVPLIIEEPFNGSEVFLNIGTIVNQTSVVHVRINNVTNIMVLPMFQDLQSDFGKIMTVPTQLFVGLKWEVERPNKGSGYGIVTLLNLNRVEGYGN